MRCASERLGFPLRQGVWCCTTPGFEQRFGRFLGEYTAVRHAEGRGSDDPEWYRAIPDRVTGAAAGEWSLRAASFRALFEAGIVPGSGEGPPLRIADLGAGHGWLASRLMASGHDAVAVDVSRDDRDGLVAGRHHRPVPLRVQADFDRLPFEAEQFDRVVWNASLHYSTRYETSLAEALRVLAPGGLVVVMDTPVYRDAESGRRMLEERRRDFQGRYGFAGDALPGEGFLTRSRLREASEGLGIGWRAHHPRHGWREVLRPWLSRLRGGRELARFPLLVGRAAGDA